jgi:hypothetical protein
LRPHSAPAALPGAFTRALRWYTLKNENLRMKLQSISLRDLGEKWVQRQIADDPAILGLGDLVLKDRERRQPRAGRLDLLLQDPESLKRYEVEIQLGATDESHIIRTIEYWDNERKLYPQHEHAAVIVAEDITSRFRNVIALFNGAIPLIALKMTGYRIGAEHALTFVRVLDEIRLGLVEDDEPVSEPADRAMWEFSRGSETSLAMTDHLLRLVNEVEPKAVLNYNRNYIGLKVGGAPLNFVTFLPRKAHVIMAIKLPRNQSTDNLLDDVGLVTLAYESSVRQYRLRIDAQPSENQRDVLLGLARRARESFGRSSE